jgi:hypothetical protein
MLPLAADGAAQETAGSSSGFQVASSGAIVGYHEAAGAHACPSAVTFPLSYYPQVQLRAPPTVRRYHCGVMRAGVTLDLACADARRRLEALCRYL